MIIVVSLEDETSPKKRVENSNLYNISCIGIRRTHGCLRLCVIFWDRNHGSQFVTVTPVFYYCSFRNSPGAYVLLVREFRFRLLIRIQTAHIYIHVLSSCYYIISHLTSIQYHLSNLKMAVELSRTLTFTRYVAHWCQREQFVYTNLCFHSKDIGSRTLVLLLAFNFSTSNVNPLPSRQEQHPVVWKYGLSFSIVYFQGLNPC